ncbi:MAG: NosD domain-containing protein, partial [Planctomycetota bacterium]
TIHVPADQPSIQAGINAAWHNDIVLVAPGSYIENISFNGKGITVKSSHGPEVTTIDGSQPQQVNKASVVTFQYLKNNKLQSVLDGFTIRGGKGTYVQKKAGYRYGGGIFCQNASPKIVNNIIVFNSACFGGGIACEGENSAPQILHNTITRNYAYSYGIKSSRGGGIYTSWGTAPVISHNDITWNTTKLYNPQGSGGGIYCQGGGNNVSHFATITHNFIAYNIARESGCGICAYGSAHLISNNTIMDNGGGESGGGIYCFTSFSFEPEIPIISNNFIAGNKVFSYGAGIVCYGEYHAVIENNVILDNISEGDAGGLSCESKKPPQRVANNIICGNKAAGDGGGIYCSCEEMFDLVNNTVAGNTAERGGGVFGTNSCSLMMRNIILWKNTASMGAEAYMEFGDYGPATLSIDYSVVWGGLAFLMVEQGNALNWGSHMGVNYPLFVDADRHDYHLTLNSPCRDAGDNSVVAEAFDFESDPRISGGIVDIGADERHDHLYCTGDFTPGGVVQAKIMGEYIPWPTALIIGSGVLDPPHSHMLGDLFLEAPLYVVPLGFIPSNGVLVVQDYLPPMAAAPYDIPMQAVIKNKLSNLFVLEVR